MNGLKCTVISKLLSNQEALDVIELIDTGHGVLEWGVLIRESLKNDLEASTEVGVLLLGLQSGLLLLLTELLVSGLISLGSLFFGFLLLVLLLLESSHLGSLLTFEFLFLGTLLHDLSGFLIVWQKFNWVLPTHSSILKLHSF